MEQTTKLKGICRKFVGTFQPFEWEKIVLLSESLKKAQVNTINNKRRRVLTITCEDGVLNVMTNLTEKVIYGNFIVHGNSVEQITGLSLWRLFEIVVRSFHTNALVQFHPGVDLCFEFWNGTLRLRPDLTINHNMEESIDYFLRHVRINYLLEKLHTVMKSEEHGQILQLKMELSALTNQSSN